MRVQSGEERKGEVNEEADIYEEYYYDMYYPNFSSGDQILITLEDESVITGSYNGTAFYDENEERLSYSRTSSQSYDNEWEAGGTHLFTLTLTDYEVSLEIPVLVARPFMNIVDSNGVTTSESADYFDEFWFESADWGDDYHGPSLRFSLTETGEEMVDFITFGGSGSNLSKKGDGYYLYSLDVEDEDEVLDSYDMTEVELTLYDGTVLTAYLAVIQTPDADSEHTHIAAAAAVKENISSENCADAISYDGIVYCTVCGEEIYRRTVYDEETGHTYVAVVTEPTCTSSGYTTYTCSHCGYSRTGDETAATGHNYTTWKVTKAVTCTTAGERTYYCANDSSHTKTEAIAATGHTYVNNVCSTCGALKSSTVSEASVTLSTSSYTYSGSAREPIPTVKVNGTTLTSGTDYTVSYSDNTNIGTATVKITAVDGSGYTGSMSKTFTIVPGRVTLSSVKSSAAKKLTVKWTKLSGSVQYQIAYQKSGSSSWSYAQGSASAVSKTLTGLTALKKYTVKVRAYKTVDGDPYYGEWSSTKSATVKKAQTLTVKTVTKTVSYSKAKKAKQTVKAITKVNGAKGTVTYTKSSGKSYFAVNKSTGKITVKKGTPKGTYTVKIKVTSSAKGNYLKTTKTVSVKIKVK